jgi:NAD(P)-dependent dehydrogenase (short-subunit alcohol dehydrogenase family)
MAIAPDFSVAGKVVLITGGAGGIGGAFAQAFLNHGANVIITDVAAPKDGTDPRIRYEQLDVRDGAAIDALASRIEGLDVVIHWGPLTKRILKHVKVFVGDLTKGKRARI